MYISVYIRDKRQDEVLVDGGAMVDLISDGVVDELGLTRYPCNDLGIRMADDTVAPLPWHVWLDINVAGILARIKAFVMPIRLSYNILLSRRWLARVNALEDHKNNILYISGIDGVRRKVKGTPAWASGLETVNLAPVASHLTQGEYEGAEDEIEALLEELDHWDDDENLPVPGKEERRQ